MTAPRATRPQSPFFGRSMVLWLIAACCPVAPRSAGVAGQRVADAAVMPNVPRANTILACITIGGRVADWLRADA